MQQDSAVQILKKWKCCDLDYVLIRIHNKKAAYAAFLMAMSGRKERVKNVESLYLSVLQPLSRGICICEG